MTPTTEAGMSIWVYTPSQAKYRPIFSPKYFLHAGKARETSSLILHGCEARPVPSPAGNSSNPPLVLWTGK